MTVEPIATPAVLVDLDVVERNIQSYQAYCDSHGLAVRPFVGSHRLPSLARAQIETGAIGIACATLAEAEVMAAAGIDNILLTGPVRGAAGLARLRALHDDITLSVAIDDGAVATALSGAFADADVPLAVLLDCDTGARFTGLPSPAAVVQLAQQLGQSMGLRFAGLTACPGPGGTAATQTFMAAAKAELASAGYACASISSAGSADRWRAHEAPVLEEYRPGSYIYNDRALLRAGACGLADCALHVLATVTGLPAPGRADIDAGSDLLGADAFGLDGHGLVRDHPEAAIASLSPDRGHLDCRRVPGGLAVGDRLRIVPNRAAVAGTLAPQVHLMQGDAIIAIQAPTPRA